MVHVSDNPSQPHGTAKGPAEPWVQATASPGLTAWLHDRHVSVAATTYQANKLCLFGLSRDERLCLFERTFPRCMGLATDAASQTLWLSSQFQIWRLENVLAPGQCEGEFDRLYVPRVGYVTGDIDVHDLAIDSQGQPLFVNTLFSCLASVSDRLNFTYLWRPEFITQLAAEDRCHLNGLAMDAGRPRYVTLGARCDTREGWREQRSTGGCVIDVQSGQVVAEGLAMPHSPRLVDGRLWLLEAGSGHLGYVDLARGKFERVTFCPGYARGMAIVGHWAVIGTSLARHEKTFQGLPLDDEFARRGEQPCCGLHVVDLQTGKIVHWLHLEGKLHELYDVVALAGVRRPKAYGFQTDEIRFHVAFEEGGQAHSWRAANRSQT